MLDRHENKFPLGGVSLENKAEKPPEKAEGPAILKSLLNGEAGTVGLRGNWLRLRALTPVMDTRKTLILDAYGLQPVRTVVHNKIGFSC